MDKIVIDWHLYLLFQLQFHDSTGQTVLGHFSDTTGKENELRGGQQLIMRLLLALRSHKWEKDFFNLRKGTESFIPWKRVVPLFYRAEEKFPVVRGLSYNQKRTGWPYLKITAHPRRRSLS